MCLNSRFVKGIIISIWTIVQTSFHILFVIGGYYICQFKPNHYLLVIIYITYFYNYDRCGNITLSEGGCPNVSNLTRLIDLETNATSEEDDIYNIIHTIVEKANLPRQSNQYFRTQLYLLGYVVYDGCWLVSAFLLFAGICFQVQKCLSILFYGPWLLITGLSTLTDVVAAVHFGIDMLQIYNYTSWLRFIGVENYRDFSKFNKYNSSTYIPHISSIAMSVFWSRFLIFWILNIVNLFSISSSFSIAYSGENTKKMKKTVRKSSSINMANQPMSSAESRIRNWQRFYGTVNTISSGSVDSSRFENRDYNSNSRSRKKSADQPRRVSGNSSTGYCVDISDDLLPSTTLF